MRVGYAQQAEAGIEIAAAASFAGAVGFAVYHAVDPSTQLPGMVAVGILSAVAAYAAAKFLLRLIGGGPQPFRQATFEVAKIDATAVAPVGELLLTAADRLRIDGHEQPLELNDVLVAITPESRVVQLFDPSAVPTAGQLQARIDRHLDGGTSHFPPPDASEALFEALADLRRSLR